MRALRGFIAVAVVLFFLEPSAIAHRAVNGFWLGSSSGSTPAPTQTIVDTGTDVQAYPTDFEGVSNVPDLAFYYYTTSGTTYSGIAAGQGGSSYEFTTSDRNYNASTVWTPVWEIGAGTAKPIISPSNPSAGATQGDSDYAGLTGCWPQFSDSTKLNCIEHGENHRFWSSGNGQAWFSVMLVQRSAAGAAGSITYRQIVISSYAARPGSAPASGCAGAGQPSFFIPPSGSPLFGDGYVYVLYFDTGANCDTNLEKVSIARALLSTDGVAGSWTKLSGGTWSQPGLGGSSDDIITRPDGIAVDGISAWQLTWNTVLQRYLLVYQLNRVGHDVPAQGWYYLVSTDLVHWSNSTLIWHLDAFSSNFTPDVMLFTPGLTYGTTGSPLFAIHPQYHWPGCGTTTCTPRMYRRTLAYL